MHQKLSIVVLENNIEFYKTLIKFFPKTPIDVNWYIYVDTREYTNFDPSKKRENVYHDICKISRESTNYNFRFNDNLWVLDGELCINGLIPKDLNEEQQEFWNFHSMTMKFVSQLFTFKIFGVKKFLYIDDDVVIFRDPSHLFEYDAFIQKMFFCKMGDNEHYQELLKLTDLNLNVDEYNKYSSCAGVMLMNEHLNNELLKIVDKFYKSEFLLNLYKQYKNKSKKYSKLFFCDQIIMNMLYTGYNYKEKPKDAIWAFGEKNQYTGKGKLIVQKEIPTLIHYGAGPHKQSWINYFNGEGFQQALINNHLL